MQTGNQSRDIQHTLHDLCNQRMLRGILLRSSSQCVCVFVRWIKNAAAEREREKWGKKENSSVSKGLPSKRGVNIPSARAPRGQNRSVVRRDGVQVVVVVVAGPQLEAKREEGITYVQSVHVHVCFVCGICLCIRGREESRVMNQKFSHTITQTHARKKRQRKNGKQKVLE